MIRTKKLPWVLLGMSLLALVLVSLGFQFSFRSHGTIPWESDFGRALKRGAVTNRPVVAYLYTDWCSYCRQMAQTTFKDPDVISEVSDRYVWLKLNAETDPKGIELRERFQVSGYPTFLFLDSESEEIDRIQGYFPPDRFADELTIAFSPQSLKMLRLQVAKEPESAVARYQLAEKFFQRQMFAEATREFSRVLEVDSDNLQGYTDASLFLLAQSLNLQGEPEGAITATQALQKRFPESSYGPDAVILEAQLLFDRGEDEEATQLLRGFVQRYPDHKHTGQIQEVLATSEPRPVPVSSH